MLQETKTIVLIHGLWMNPRSWENFRSFYEAQGLRVLAPAWPRMACSVETLRSNPKPLAGLGLHEVADHYERIVRMLPSPPILIGHSMGGLIVQILDSFVEARVRKTQEKGVIARTEKKPSG